MSADVKEKLQRWLDEASTAMGGDATERRDALLELETTILERIDERTTDGESQAEEAERIGIPNLKVGFNRVFGYYIEISRSNLHATPADYQRKQTVAGGERFTTPALEGSSSSTWKTRIASNGTSV